MLTLVDLIEKGFLKEIYLFLKKRFIVESITDKVYLVNTTELFGGLEKQALH